MTSNWPILPSFYILSAHQLPRLYNIYKDMGIVTSFQNILDNIFIPLFEATVDPDSHPQLHVFLKQVSIYFYKESPIQMSWNY